MSFSKFHNDPELPTRYLRSKAEWDKLRQDFKQDLPRFWEVIRVGNPIVSKKNKKAEGQAAPTVESSHARHGLDSAVPEDRTREQKMDAKTKARPEPSLEDFFDDLEAPIEDPKGKSSPEPTKEPEPPGETQQKTKVKPNKEIPAKPDAPAKPSAMDGFDQQGFHEAVGDSIENAFSMAKRHDLDAIIKNVGDYSVSLAMSGAVEQVHLLNEKIAEVQQYKDSLFPHMLAVKPVLQVIDDVVGYAEDVGVAFSSASNRETRIAQTRLAIKGLLDLHSKVKHANALLDTTWKHLDKQHFTLNAMVECLRQQSYEIRKGKLPDRDHDPVREAEPPADPPRRDDPPFEVEIDNSVVSGLDDFNPAGRKKNKKINGTEELDF